MKNLRQFFVIILLSFIGEVLHRVLPLPVPASIYGLILMLVLLCTGVIKLEQVENASDFLVEIMPVMFIPAAVGLMVSWNSLKSMLVACIIIATVSTAIVMGVSGKITDFIIEKRNKH